MIVTLTYKGFQQGKNTFNSAITCANSQILFFYYFDI